MASLPLERRYRTAREPLAAHPDVLLLDRPLSTWVIASDRYLPQQLLTLPLREVLKLSFEQLNSRRGIGERKLEMLVELISRAQKEIASQIPVDSLENHQQLNGQASFAEQPPIYGSLPSRAEDITDETWELCSQFIHRHRLHDHPLGRFVRSLSDLSSSYWRTSLSTFTSKSLAEIEATPGYGPSKIRQIVDVVLLLARLLESMPPEATLSIRLLPATIGQVLSWIEQVLAHQEVPDVQTLTECFVEPLLDQVELDLNETTAALLRRRLGIDRPRETLEEIATELGITRERVRQITAKASEVFAVRWPEAKHLMDDFFDYFQAAPDAEEQVELIRLVLDSMFGVSFVRGASRNDVLAAWDRAGRQKLTPMRGDELSLWLARECPNVHVEVGRRWLMEDCLTCTDDEGRTLFFSNEPLDHLLHHLFLTDEPLPLAVATDFVEGDEQSIHRRLERDPRFIEDEYKRILAAERNAFFRRAGAWHARLIPSTRRELTARSSSISLDNLIHLVLSGMLQQGIVDATVWGVHRFTNNMLERIYGATLALPITPFILASMLVQISEGLIRHLRRRRLRWDAADPSLEVRGKRGWVNHLVAHAGVPMLLEELDAGLRLNYQDYESYIIDQLFMTLNEDNEEGDTSCGARIIPGTMKRVPTIVIPGDWKLDLGRENVSEGIKLLVAKIIHYSTKNKYSKRHLRRVPWLIELVEHQAYGNMTWADDRDLYDEDTLDVADILEVAKFGQSTGVESGPVERRVQPRQQPEVGERKIEDLLSQFL